MSFTQLTNWLLSMTACNNVATALIDVVTHVRSMFYI